MKFPMVLFVGASLLTCDSEEAAVPDVITSEVAAALTLPEQAAIEAANAHAEHRHPPGLSMIERGFPPMDDDCPGNGNGQGCGGGGGQP